MASSGLSFPPVTFAGGAAAAGAAAGGAGAGAAALGPDGGGWRSGANGGAGAAAITPAAAAYNRLRATPLCLFTAKPEELSAIVEVMRAAHSRAIAIDRDPIIDAHEQKFFAGEMEVRIGYKVPFYITSGFKQGVQSFAISASYVFSEYQPKWACMVGICAGNADKLKGGDVIFACTAVQYEEGKMDKDGVLHPSTKAEHAARGVADDVAELLKTKQNGKWKVASMLSGCAVLENAATVFQRVTHSVRTVIRAQCFLLVDDCLFSTPDTADQQPVLTVAPVPFLVGGASKYRRFCAMVMHSTWKRQHSSPRVISMV